MGTKFFKKFKWKLCCIAALIYLAGTAPEIPLAASVSSITLDVDSQDLTIRGTTDALVADKIVALEMVNPGYDVHSINLEDPNAVTPFFGRIWQTKSALDGSFTFQYNMAGSGGTSGLYTIRIKGAGADRESVSTLQYYRKDEIISTLLSIDSKIQQKDLNGLKPILSDPNHISMLALSFPVFENIKGNSAIWEPICSALVNLGRYYEPNAKLSENMRGLQTNFQRAVIMEALNVAVDKDSIENMFETSPGYFSLLGLDNSSAYTKFQAMGEESQDAIYQGLLGSGYHNGTGYMKIEEVKNNFHEKLLIPLLKGINGWGGIVTFLSTYNDILGLDLTKRNYSTDGVLREAAAKQIADDVSHGTISNIPDIRTAFDNAVEEQYGLLHEPEPGHSGGSSRSGSGGSGTVININPPMVTAPLSAQGTVHTELTDIADVPWAAESINELAKLEVIAGYEDGTFRPNDPVTRAQFIKMLISCFGLLDTTATADFEDVNPNDWYYSFVASARKLGLANGAYGRFDADSPVTRQDMAVLAYRVANSINVTLPVPDSNVDFADAINIREYALPGISAMQQAGIIGGSDGNFMPDETTTRAQAAKVIYSMYKISREGQSR